MLNKKINSPLTRRSGHLFIATLLLMLTTLCSASESSGITISSASLEQQGKAFLLNAKINYRLSPETIDALSNGITIVLNVKFSTIEQRRWLWDKHSYTLILPYQIKYHTFAETYQVTDLTTLHQQNFSSLSAAIDALGSLDEIPLHQLSAKNVERHTGTISAHLNIEALPLPMRPMAYLTPAWHLNSDTFEWPLK